jgi:hypothetical protein
MSEELSQIHGGRIDRLERDVGDLKTDFATVKSDLRAFGALLGEIKQGLNNARPAWYVLLPILISFIVLIAGGILAFASIKTDVAGLSAMRDSTQKMEQRQWEINTRVARLEGRNNVPAQPQP